MCDSFAVVPDAVRNNTLALVRQLMSKYGIGPDHVLRHYDVTGKNCPAPWVLVPADWMEFKKMLEEDDTVTQEQFDAMMEKYTFKTFKQRN